MIVPFVLVTFAVTPGGNEVIINAKSPDNSFCEVTDNVALIWPPTSVIIDWESTEVWITGLSGITKISAWQDFPPASEIWNSYEPSKATEPIVAGIVNWLLNAPAPVVVIVSPKLNAELVPAIFKGSIDTIEDAVNPEPNTVTALPALVFDGAIEQVARLPASGIILVSRE